ncbi:GldG family protein [Roseburia hominis]
MDRIKKMWKSASSKYGTYSLVLTAVVIAIAVVVNLVVSQLPEKWKNVDISDNRLYEISDVSRNMLKKLDQKVTMNVIAELDSIDDRIETFVKKYAALSGKIEVKWTDSVLHPSALKENDTEGDVIVVSCEETGKSTTIPFSSIIEYDQYSYYTTGQMSETSFDGEGQLTGAVNYVTSDSVKKIYRTSGHGEETFSTSVTDLFSRNNLETEEINLSMNPEIPSDCDLLFLYGPTSDITDDEKELILNYLADGGNVYLILGDAANSTPNLNAVMERYGLRKADGYIADMQRNYQGNYYAIFPQLSLSGDLGTGISNEMVLLVNSLGMEKLDTEDSESLMVSPFMQTSSNAYAVTENDEAEGQYILGAVATEAVSADGEDSSGDDAEENAGDGTEEDAAESGDDSAEGNTESDSDSSTSIDDTEEPRESRLTVLASTSMINSEITDQLTTLDNLTLFVNSVTENFDDVENLAIEAKSLATEQNTPMHAGSISLIVIFVIPLAVLVFGFVVWMRRRKA